MIHTILAAEVKRRFVKQETAAQALGIARPYLSMMLAGKRPPSDKLLEGLGYKRVVQYVKVEPAHG